MKLTPQQQQIINFLNDREWHCMANEMFMKDDRKRISELNRLGYTIKGVRCNGLCGKKHSSRVYMRRIESSPPPVMRTEYILEIRDGERVRVAKLVCD